ncbi:hypothetical protein BDN70DRAFT_799166, partial [Pholiota conissans]
YTGQDIHNAVHDSHWEAARLNHLNNDQQRKKSTLKSFDNRSHELPKAGTAKPLDHLDNTHPSHEFPLPNKHNLNDPSPARVIVQNVNGHHVFQGVIAHDQSRTPGRGNGYNDHFHVPAQRPVHR